MFNKILLFFDKLEDHIRDFLSRFPLVYGIVGGISIVAFWRAVWMIFDNIEIFNGISGGVISLIFSTLIMLATGLFVSFFVGDTIILSGLKHQKKLHEKNNKELKDEDDKINSAFERLNAIEKNIAEIKDKINSLK